MSTRTRPASVSFWPRTLLDARGPACIVAMMGKQAVLADFFSGCGGASLGFLNAGFDPVVAVDSDADAAATYRRNFRQTAVLERDIRGLGVSEVGETLGRSGEAVRLFACCAPCQPFSSHQKNRIGKDERVPLLLEFLRFV